jgi:RimJ/RimL family protein N-acetyltransferase
MNIQIKKFTVPTKEITEAINRWENDPHIIPMIRPNKNKEALESRYEVTIADLEKRLENHYSYLIYSDNQLVGEMNYMIDPGHLFKKESGTAWIGITIGDPAGRGKGIGYLAMEHLECEIKRNGLRRIELGVFEFNKQAIKLYKKLGYNEIGRIEGFTYWKEKMWTDIRMEKYIN